MTQISAVLFDIGNVLIRWDPEGYYDRAIGPARRAAFFEAFDFFGLMDRIDAGAPFSATVEAEAMANPAWGAEIRALRDDWCGIAQPAIPHSVRLLKALKAKGFPVFALSNFGSGNFPWSARQFPFLTLFDRSYISGEMGLIKPDPAIYEAVEADCALPPGTLLFADDRADNIAAAAARGWHTHLFEHPRGWADCLVHHTLLTKDEAT